MCLIIIIQLLCYALAIKTTLSTTTTIRSDIGGTITLSCGMQKDNLYQVRWVDEHNKTLVYKLLSKLAGDKDFLQRAVFDVSSGTLTVHNLTVDNGHKYVCLYRSNAHRPFRKIAEYIVIVDVPAKVIIMDGHDDEGTLWVEEGQPANITCSVPVVKPAATIFWKVNDKVLPLQPDTEIIQQIDTTYSIASTLTESFTKVDEVKVECFVANQINNVPITSTGRKVAVYYRPKTAVISEIVEILPREADDYVLICAIVNEAYPLNVTAYEWYHNGTILPQNGSQLVLTHLHRYRNSGHYQCAAQNTAGMGEMGEELDLKVWYVSASLAAKPVIEGTAVTIQCTLDVGSPDKLTEVVWYKDDNILDIDGSDHINGGTKNRPSITFHGVSHADDGSYICQLQNGAGKVNSSVVDVAVLYPPVALTTQQTFKGAAIGSSATIAVKARSNPANRSYIWTFNGQDLRDGIKGTETDVITISNVRDVDYGTYKCVVSNVIKGDIHILTVSVHLMPQSEPYAPTEMSAVAVSSQRINVTWMTGFNGGFEQSFTLEVKEEDNDHSEFRELASDIADPSPANIPTTVTYSVPGLRPDTEYEFWIKAVNRNSNNHERESAWVTFDGKTKVKPQAVLTKLDVNYGHPTTLNVTYEVVAGSPSRLDLLFVKESTFDVNDWKVILPNLALDNTSHSGPATENLDNTTAYSFLIQSSERDDITPIDEEYLLSINDENHNTLWIIITLTLAVFVAIAIVGIILLKMKKPELGNVKLEENLTASDGQNVSENSGYEEVDIDMGLVINRSMVPAALQIDDVYLNTQTTSENLSIQDVAEVPGPAREALYLNQPDNDQRQSYEDVETQVLPNVHNAVNGPAPMNRAVYFEIRDGKDVPEEVTAENDELSDEEATPTAEIVLSDTNSYDN